MVDNLSEARKITIPPKGEAADHEPAKPATHPMAPGRGRHRRPS